ncbi:hypothetical protein DPEC_G00320140 [Dallia pectoralis]|uniref:Uncharacterized protein n=1 Tax=Dallia pectoralis TaxID=75939 RepID=A0ACC2F9Q4_DALPE|nr:hypothetical protein DPEC_G00320140 [Dallia pectoralis]
MEKKSDRMFWKDQFTERMSGWSARALSKANTDSGPVCWETNLVPDGCRESVLVLLMRILILCYVLDTDPVRITKFAFNLLNLVIHLDAIELLSDGSALVCINYCNRIRPIGNLTYACFFVKWAV